MPLSRITAVAMRTNSLISFVEPIPEAAGANRAGAWLVLTLALACAAGCGTTRASNTRRTATEQLLISDAVDRAVDQMDLGPLAGKTIYFDAQYIRGTTDEGYIISSFRQKLLASGCILKDRLTDADYVVELRSGAVGTNSDGVVFGVPSVNVPPALAAVGGVSAGVPAIPEIPLIKRTDQKAVIKFGAYAYNRADGKAYWQSGVQPIASTARDIWFFGAGPFQSGTIYDGTKFVGGSLLVPTLKSGEERVPEEVAVTKAAVFNEAIESSDGGVALATFDEAAEKKPAKPDPKPAAPAPDKPPAKPAAPAPATPPAKPAAPATPPAKPAATSPAKPAAPAPAKPVTPPPAKPAASSAEPAPPPAKPAASSAKPAASSAKPAAPPAKPAATPPPKPSPSPPTPPRKWPGPPSSKLRSTTDTVITFEGPPKQ